jgi:predicted short-subunit dehydrogenase-like oxidoreductase (DUF2520 family)
MLPGMASKPQVAIVGAGNLGTALAVSLREAGFVIDAVIGRSPASLRKARAVARRVGAPAILDPTQTKAGWIWFCVPDSEIGRAATVFAERLPWKGKVALHSSGALTSDVLNPLRRVGAAVASVHPLMAFVRDSRPSLTGVPFAIEGDPIAVRAARYAVRSLGGQPFVIRKKDKVPYHAWGMFSSPLLAALLATTEEVAAMAGINRKAARERAMPILRQTLENYAALGAPGAFSGPIIRGDVDTVRRHLRALKGAPVAHEVYTALARAAVQYLPAKNKSPLKKVLGDGRR